MNIPSYLELIDEVNQKGTYCDNWESLSAYPVPEWYTQGRFGLFIHWGVYSVPAYGSEWYPRHMYYADTKEYRHHVKTYGPVDQFGFKDLIPMFRAEKFDADEWLDLFEQSGAKYIMPVGEHHDGFKMYASDLNRWNSVEMGPKRDILAELHAACDRHGIGFCTSSHRAEHYWFLNGGRTQSSDVQDETYRDLYGPAVEGKGRMACEGGIVPTKEWLEDWLASTCEMIDRNKPLAIYFDWWVRQDLFRPYMKKFLAYYYNRSLEWGKEVCVFYKWDSIMYGCAIFDVERGQLDYASERIWQNDTAIAKNSWGYTEGNQFKTPCEIVQNLIDVVSKNGCYMLNVGPKAEGTVCDEEKHVLLEIGKWMRKNGEAIYGAKSWRAFGEGMKKKKSHGSFHEKGGYEKNEYRFTYKTGAIYVFAMRPQAKGVYLIKSLGSGNGNDKVSFLIKQVKALGFENQIAFTQSAKGLELRVHGGMPTDMPICFQVEID